METKINQNQINNELSIPSHLQRVEYIQSSGTQYIDTDVKGSGSVWLFTYLKFGGSFSYGTGVNTMFLGARDSSADFGSNFGASSGQSRYVLFWNNSIYDGESSVRRIENAPVDTVNRFCITETSFLYGETALYKQNPDISQRGNIILFGVYDTNEVKPFNAWTNMEIHKYCAIYNYGICVRYYVPVYNTLTSEYGLYDMINGKFYGNDGTGAFAGGNE